MADLGQVFTKGNVACYMFSLFNLPKQAVIMDPCYGAGSFLDALLADEYSNVTACEMDTTLFENGNSVCSYYKIYSLYKRKKEKNFKEGKEYGSARWGNEKDIGLYIYKNFNNNIIYSK